MKLFKKNIFLIFSLIITQNNFSAEFVKRLFLGPERYFLTQDEISKEASFIKNVLKTIKLNRFIGNFNLNTNIYVPCGSLPGAGYPRAPQEDFQEFVLDKQETENLEKIYKIAYPQTRPNSYSLFIQRLNQHTEKSSISHELAELEQEALKNIYNNFPSKSARLKDKALKATETLTALGLLTFGVCSILKNDPSRLAIPAITAGVTLATTSILSNNITNRPTIKTTVFNFGIATLVGTITCAGSSFLNGSLRGFNR